MAATTDRTELATEVADIREELAELQTRFARVHPCRADVANRSRAQVSARATSYP